MLQIKLYANNFISKLNYTQAIIGKQNSQIIDYGNKIQNLENDLLKVEIELDLLKENQEFKEQYIKFLEAEIELFGNKLRKLGKHHPALKIFSKDSI